MNMKRLISVLAAAAITITLLTWVVGGDDYHLEGKQWQCETRDAGQHCTVEVTLVNGEEHELAVNLTMRVSGVAIPDDATAGQAGAATLLLEQQQVERLGPLEHKRVRREFQVKGEVQRVLLLALGVRKELVE